MGDKEEFKAFREREKAQLRERRQSAAANTKARRQEQASNVVSDLKMFPVFVLVGAVAGALILTFTGEPSLLGAIAIGFILGAPAWYFLWRDRREAARMRFRMKQARSRASAYSNPYPYGSADWESYNRTMGV